MDNLLMRRPDLENLPPITPLPAGYTLRTFQEDDLEPLAVLLDAVFTEEAWTPELVKERLVAAPDVKKIFVIAQDDVLVATASARIDPERFPDSGYVHWVAVHPDHRGKGLGTLITLATLHEFVRMGCKDAVLETQDKRKEAIKLYMNLGFKPVHIHESHLLRWALIAEMLASANL